MHTLWYSTTNDLLYAKIFSGISLLAFPVLKYSHKTAGVMPLQ